MNPVVAVLLGWSLAGETLDPRIWLATALIVGSVVAITRHQTGARAPALEEPDPPRPAEPTPRVCSREAGE